MVAAGGTSGLGNGEPAASVELSAGIAAGAVDAARNIA
jgi:hypothetical protein